jgi:hypothetical protein
VTALTVAINLNNNYKILKNIFNTKPEGVRSVGRPKV